jgi:hypothetical protein
MTSENTPAVHRVQMIGFALIVALGIGMLALGNHWNTKQDAWIDLDGLTTLLAFAVYMGATTLVVGGVTLYRALALRQQFTVMSALQPYLWNIVSLLVGLGAIAVFDGCFLSLFIGTFALGTAATYGLALKNT